MYELEKVLVENGLEIVRNDTNRTWQEVLEHVNNQYENKKKLEKCFQSILYGPGHFKICNIVKFAKKNNIKGVELKTLRAVKEYIALRFLNNGEIGMLRKYDGYDRVGYMYKEKERYLRVYGLTKEYRMKKVFNEEYAKEFVVNHICDTFEKRLEKLKSGINYELIKQEMQNALEKDIENISKIKIQNNS